MRGIRPQPHRGPYSPSPPAAAVSQHQSEVRHFTSPSGRRWTASIFDVPLLPDAPPDAPTHVLRFESGDLILDLEHWPTDWTLRSEAELVELARQASTPDFRPWCLRTPARGRPRY